MTTKKENLSGIENITKSRIIANNTIEYKKGRVKFIPVTPYRCLLRYIKTI